MHLAEQLSFLAVVTEGPEDEFKWSQSLPRSPEKRTEQLLRKRLMRARERASRWDQEKRKKSPQKRQTTSAYLHRAYREPMPAPPPNSPRYSLLGLPLPLEGVPYINPQNVFTSPRSEGDHGKYNSNNKANEDIDKDFDSDGFRDLDSCDGDDDTLCPNTVKNLPREGTLDGRGVRNEGTSRDPGKKSSFVDIFYKAMRQEVKIREAINLPDLEHKKAQARKNSKKQVKLQDAAFEFFKEEDRYANNNQQHNTQSSRILSPLLEWQRSNKSRVRGFCGKSLHETENFQMLRIDGHTDEMDNVSSLAPVIVRKDISITNSLNSNLLPFAEFPQEQDNRFRVSQSTYQTFEQRSNRRYQSQHLAKRPQFRTEKITEKLEENRTLSQSLFDVGIRKTCETSTFTKYSTTRKHNFSINQNLSSPMNLHSSILNDACENVKAMESKQMFIPNQNYSSKTCAAKRLYLSAINSASMSDKHIREETKSTSHGKLKGKEGYCHTLKTQEENVHYDVGTKTMFSKRNTLNTQDSQTLLSDVMLESAKPDTSINIKKEIARNISLFAEINDSLAHAASHRDHALNQTVYGEIPKVNMKGNPKPNCDVNAIAVHPSQNINAFRRNVKLSKNQNQYKSRSVLDPQESVFGFMKEVVKLKRARMVT